MGIMATSRPVAGGSAERGTKEKKEHWRLAHVPIEVLAHSHRFIIEAKDYWTVQDLHGAIVDALSLKGEIVEESLELSVLDDDRVLDPTMPLSYYTKMKPGIAPFDGHYILAQVPKEGVTT